MAGGSYYEVQVRPNADGWSAKLEAQVGPQVRRLAEEIRKRLSEASKGAFDGIGARLEANVAPSARRAADDLRDQLRRGLREGLNGTPGNSTRQGNQSGGQYADAFSRQVQSKLQAALRALPDVQVRADTSAIDRELINIRRELASTVGQLDLGVDASSVERQVADLQARLKAMAENTTDVRVRVNTTAALAEVEAFQAALKGEGRKSGDDFADAFSREIRTKIVSASQSLPDIKIDGNSSAADRAIAEIRAKLAGLDEKIKLGLDDKVAVAELDVLRLRLKEMAANDVDIRVRVNSRSALHELDSITQALNTQSAAAVSAGGGGGDAATLAKVAAIGAAISAIGPLASAAAAGILGIAGAAGVAALAVIGLKKQMAEKVGFGEAISTQVKSLAQEIGGLGQVAANAVGPAVLSLVQFVRNAIPSFQGLVTLVGGRLGGAFKLVGGALVQAFQKAAPIVVDVAGYIEQGAAALGRWVASPSFDQFLTYARQQLPIVIGYAKDFGKAVIDTFVALAPAGEDVLAFFDLLAKGLSKLANSGALKAIVAITTPLVGVGGLIGRLFGADDDVAKKASSASAATNSLLSSFQRLGSSASDVAKQAAPLDSYKSIVGDLVPQLQLAAGNAGVFQVAVTGVTDRLRSAAPALQAFMDTASSYVTNTTPKLADTAKLIGDAFTAARGYALDYATAMVGADTATLGLTKTLHDNLASVSKDGTLLGVSHLDAAGKFVAAAGKYTQGSSDIAAAFQQQVKAATDAATSTFISVKSSTDDTAQAGQAALTVYKGIREQLIQQGLAAGYTAEQVNGLADQYFAIPPSVDTFIKQVGAENVNLAIQGLTDALNRLSDFIGAPKVELNTTDYDRSKAKVDSDLDYYGNRTTLTSLDLSTGQFDQGAARSNTVLDILNGRTASPTVTVTDYASNKLQAIRSALASLQDKTLTVTQRTILYSQTVAANDGVGGGSTVNAYGGYYSQVGHYARGGIVEGLAASVRKFARGSERHVPQIAMPNGGVRVWAEPETQGEAYIPFALDRRARSEDILANVARRFDGAFLSRSQIAAAAPAAARSSGATSGGGGGEVIVNVIDRDGSFVERMRGEILTRESNVRLRSAGGSASVIDRGPNADRYLPTGGW